MIDSGKIIIVAVLFETILAIVGLAWCAYSDISIISSFSASHFLTALLVVLFLLMLQLPIRKLVRHYPIRFSATKTFITEVVEPFCLQLTIKQAVVVSVAAGVGEEILFRGALLSEIGIVGSSLLFAVMHFGWRAYLFPFFVLCYFLISVILSVQYLYFGGIIGVILTHSLYDFLAIAYYKRLAKVRKPQAD